MTGGVTLRAGNTEARVLAHGLTLASFRVDGGEYVVGLAEEADYLGSHPFVGTVVGPLANRVRGGKFMLDGETVRVATNENGNTLHGGPDALDRQVWEVVESSDRRAVFAYTMPDGHEGWPGPLVLRAEVEVEPGVLNITYTATAPERPAAVGLSQHTYFTVPGVGRADDLRLTLHADSYTAVDGEMLPTDYNVPVEGTAFDFREGRDVGELFVDNSFNIAGEGLRPHARMAFGGKVLSVLSDLPASQVFTGEALEAAGLPSRRGLAVEPQYPPDLINTDRAEDVTVRPGEAWRHTIRYEVSTDVSA